MALEVPAPDDTGSLYQDFIKTALYPAEKVVRAQVAVGSTMNIVAGLGTRLPFALNTKERGDAVRHIVIDLDTKWTNCLTEYLRGNKQTAGMMAEEVAEMCDQIIEITIAEADRYERKIRGDDQNPA